MIAEPLVSFRGKEVTYVVCGTGLSICGEKCYCLISIHYSDSTVRFGNANQIDNMMVSVGRKMFTQWLDKTNGGQNI